MVQYGKNTAKAALLRYSLMILLEAILASFEIRWLSR